MESCNKTIYFVTGLSHSGTSIVQKTIGDQEGYFIRLKQNKNINENKDFVIEINKYKKSGKVAMESLVSKLPCEEIYFKDIFDDIKKYMNESNLHVIFMKRNPINWCFSQMKRKISKLDLKNDINNTNNKIYKRYNYKLGYKYKKQLELKGLKSVILYYKDLYDAYEKEVIEIMNCESNAKFTYVNLEDFAENPEQILKEIGFKNPVIKGINNFSEIQDFRKINDHENIRAAQIASVPSPDIIRSSFDFHYSIIDFVKKVFEI